MAKRSPALVKTPNLLSQLFCLVNQLPDALRPKGTKRKSELTEDEIRLKRCVVKVLEWEPPTLSTWLGSKRDKTFYGWQYEECLNLWLCLKEVLAHFQLAL